MRYFVLICLIGLGGCATRHLMPANRFMTPESQGGMFHGQLELQYTQATEAMLITNGGRVDEGVLYTTIPRTGYMFSNSFFDSLDFIWSHVAGGNSLAGGKIQFLGSSRTAKSTGNKLALVALMGGNEHESADKSLKFRLDAQEILLIYGYRINEVVLPYVSIGSASYKWAAEIKSPYPEIDGQEPVSKTTVKSVNLGVQNDLQNFFLKAELSYQQLTTTDTKDKTTFGYGISAGLSW